MHPRGFSGSSSPIQSGSSRIQGSLFNLKKKKRFLSWSKLRWGSEGQNVLFPQTSCCSFLVFFQEPSQFRNILTKKWLSYEKWNHSLPYIIPRNKVSHIDSRCCILSPSPTVFFILPSLVIITSLRSLAKCWCWRFLSFHLQSNMKCTIKVWFTTIFPINTPLSKIEC